ncbi:MAG: DNA glycosylase AlkZ-like family protein, partial [Gaiellaceae bacterium]
RLSELVRDGALRQIAVEGWREPGSLHPEARLPRRISAVALLSPFDPVLWTRARVARLFGFDYRFEIFVPEEQRRWGVYVLPFLQGDRLVARVDLKAERSSGSLVVGRASLEPGSEPAEVLPALAGELAALARWLGLTAVRVDHVRGLGGQLAAELRR